MWGDGNCPGGCPLRSQFISLHLPLRPHSHAGCSAGPWECPECTQENEPGDEVCCACDAPRPAAAAGGDAGAGAFENYKVQALAEKPRHTARVSRPDMCTPFTQVGVVVACEAIEGKDKLKKISVDVGAAEPVTVVTNAANVYENSRIVVALVWRNALACHDFSAAQGLTCDRGKESERVACLHRH